MIFDGKFKRQRIARGDLIEKGEPGGDQVDGVVSKCFTNACARSIAEGKMNGA